MRAAAAVEKEVDLDFWRFVLCGRPYWADCYLTTLLPIASVLFTSISFSFNRQTRWYGQKQHTRALTMRGTHPSDGWETQYDALVPRAFQLWFEHRRNGEVESAMFDIKHSKKASYSAKPRAQTENLWDDRWSTRRTVLSVSSAPKHKTEVCAFFHICHLVDMSTYDHRSVRTGHPVRSAIHKH
jgi:hypothetical protein